MLLGDDILSDISPADVAADLHLTQNSISRYENNQREADYETLIRGIQSASPDTAIIVCTITSVTISYSGSDGLEFTLVNEANEWLTQICADTGVFFADAASAVSDSNGSLLTEYASANGKTLNSAGLNQILTYLRNHAIAF